MAEPAAMASPTTLSLPTELRTAIKTRHHALNTLIMSQLPLCLPPHTDSPFLYLAGITLFGAIYSKLETFHTDTLAHTTASTSPRTRLLLRTLHTTNLRRTERLNADLAGLLSCLNDAQRKQIARLQSRSTHIFASLQTTLDTQPHLLFAWQWCLYLALFNGGRYIRRSLRGARAGFWRGAEMGREDEELPLRFWEFDGGEDGEDVRVEFMSRFEEASALLSEGERGNVVVEAGRVFDVCEEMVGVLDVLVEELGPTWDVGGHEGVHSNVLPRRRGEAVSGDQRSRWRIVIEFGFLLAAATAFWQYLLSACLSAKRLLFSGARSDPRVKS